MKQPSIEEIRKAEAFLHTLKGDDGRVMNRKGNFYCCSECHSSFAPGELEKLLAMYHNS